MGHLIRLSEATNLALHAGAVLAGDTTRRVPAREIAALLGVSQAHLSKVLKRLERGGVVTSTRGPGGGYSLARKPRDITLLEIYERIDGPVMEAECLLGSPICKGSCALRGLLGVIHQDAKRYLARTRLADLTGKTKLGSRPAGRTKR